MDVPVPQIHEEFVDSAQMTPQERAWCMFEAPEPAESPGVAGGTSDTTSTAATAFDTAVEKSVGEARPPEIAKDWATTVDTAQSESESESESASESESESEREREPPRVGE